MWNDSTFTRWINIYSMFVVQENSGSSRFEDLNIVSMNKCDLLVFHGTQSTAHVNFHNIREEKKESEGGEAIEGTLV